MQKLGFKLSQQFALFEQQFFIRHKSK